MRPARRFAAGWAALIVLCVPAACNNSTKHSTPIRETPISKRIGFDPLLTTADNTGYADKLRTCMADRGFQYFTTPTATTPQTTDGTDGFGIASFYLGALTPDPRSQNDTYRGSLSAAAQAQYDLALNGPLRASDADVPFAKLGCIPQLQIQIYGGDAATPKPLQTAVDDVRALARSDAGYVAALEKWRTCMKRAGFDAASHDDLVRSFQDSVDQIAGRTDNSMTVLNLDDQTRSKLTALQAQEVAAAFADGQCRTSSHVDGAYQTALLTAEAKVVEQSPALFDRSTWPPPSTHP